MDDLYEDLEETIILLRDIIVELPKRYQENLEGIERCQGIEQDLLHMIELSSFNCAEGWGLSDQLKKNRLQRREMKDENDLLACAIDVLKKMKKQETNNLNAALGRMRKAKLKKDNRQYRTRHLHELCERINGG